MCYLFWWIQYSPNIQVLAWSRFFFNQIDIVCYFLSVLYTLISLSFFFFSQPEDGVTANGGGELAYLTYSQKS